MGLEVESGWKMASNTINVFYGSGGGNNAPKCNITQWVLTEVPEQIMKIRGLEKRNMALTRVPEHLQSCKSHRWKALAIFFPTVCFTAL